MQERFLTPLIRQPATAWQLRTPGGCVLAERVQAAFDSASRRKGLLGRDHFPAGEALIIAPSNAIHTFRMRFPIDVLFIDRQGHVRKVCPDLVPWRLAASLRASAVIELPAGTLRRCAVAVGDALVIAGPEA